MAETAFDRAIGVMFGNADLARSAVYTPPGESPTPVSLSVVPSVQDPDAAAMRSRRNIMVFEVRVADLGSPVENGTLTVDSVAYRIQGRPAFADDERLTWRVECYEVPA